ncbi:MAG: hypothetical protein ABEH60_04600 [Halonotius sp.]
MSSDPPAESEEADDENDRSYEERVQEELVPDIGVGEPAQAGEELADDPTGDEDVGSLSEALGEVDDELGNAFVGILVGVKLGVLLISAGALAIGFAGMTTLGGGLVGVGCLAFARAGQRYWAYERTRNADSEGERSDPDEGGAAASEGRNG